LSMPRALRPLMMLLPMKPAAPVTTIFMVNPWLALVCAFVQCAANSSP
jgi:hypothetical protein